MDQFEFVIVDHLLADTQLQLAALADGTIWPPATEKRLGVWQVAIGPLNRFYLLRTRTEDAPHTDGAFLSSRIEGVREVKPFHPAGEWAQFHELRIYELRPSHTDEIEHRMRQIMHLREQYSPNVGIWRPVTGNSNRLIHMWAYRDMMERDEVRLRISSNPEWQAYVAAITPGVLKMESMLMTSLRFCVGQDEGDDNGL